MAANSHRKREEEQFLRKAFDAAYEITPENVAKVYQRIPKRTRWMVVTTIAAFFLAVIMIKLGQVGAEQIEWAMRPSLSERLNAPYDRAEKPAPVIDDSLMVVFVPSEEDVIAETDVVAGEAVVESDVSAAEAAAVEEEPAVFYVLPEVNGYTRDRVTAETVVHPTLNCFFEVDSQTGTGCGMSFAYGFLEAADYMGDNGSPVRVTIAAYHSEWAADRSIVELYRHSRSIGSVGNYQMMATMPTNYYFAQKDGWTTFFWAKENWVFTISARSAARIDAFVNKFPY